MNIIKNLIERIEDYRKTNANPCKSYATEAAAEKATAQVAADCAVYFHGQTGSADTNIPSAHYVVFYVPSWGRWVGAINQSEVMRRYFEQKAAHEAQPKGK